MPATRQESSLTWPLAPTRRGPSSAWRAWSKPSRRRGTPARLARPGPDGRDRHGRQPLLDPDLRHRPDGPGRPDAWTAPGPPGASSRWKALELLRIAARDLSGEVPLEAVGPRPGRAGGRSAENGHAANGREREMAVVAMGKLGARELNYGSDIDIMLVAGRPSPDAGGGPASLAHGPGPSPRRSRRRARPQPRLLPARKERRGARGLSRWPRTSRAIGSVTQVRVKKGLAAMTVTTVRARAGRGAQAFSGAGHGLHQAASPSRPAPGRRKRPGQRRALGGWPAPAYAPCL